MLMECHMLLHELNDLCYVCYGDAQSIKPDAAHGRELTCFLEELLPDAVRRGVLTCLHGHRQGRVLLENPKQKTVSRSSQTASQDPWGRMHHLHDNTSTAIVSADGMGKYCGGQFWFYPQKNQQGYSSNNKNYITYTDITIGIWFGMKP